MAKPKKYGISISMRYPEDVYFSIKQQSVKLVRSMNEQAIYWTRLGMEHDNSYDKSNEKQA